ncbi:MAG: hypothetical protein KF696_08505 [Planctomycetes bacterium]|nr:hypothetical protein [Planctomycetota bacterium]MCW8135609.1 hypothetical protein [Planctomycetota bacterium]
MDWQDRCSQLVGLLLPARTFTAGEFENLTDAQWDALMAEARAAAKTDARFEAQELRQQLEALSASEAALNKARTLGLSAAEIEALARIS